MLRKKKVFPKRTYHDGDVIEFDFESNSLDINGHKVTIIGVVSGVSCEEDCIFYKIQLRDNKRNILGDMIVPEDKITRKVSD